MDAPSEGALSGSVRFAAEPAAGDSPRFAGRYDLIRLLKQGNGVATYLAVDSVTALQVVVKVFDAHTVQPGMRARFVHETRVLRELSGLGVCALHDAGQTDTALYLVQQYAPGRPLDQVLAGGALPVDAVLQIGISVAAALEAAHGAGVYHRDVKPANIVVEHLDSADPAVTLIDFGFARSPWLDEAIREDLVGTVRYLAPEAAGLLSSSADGRSDLYAMGVVLYECLVGVPPFDAPGVGELLRQHLNTPVPPLTRAPHAVPRALAAVVHRLLRKDPADRYQSAAAVRADLEQIRAAIATGSADPSVVIGRQDRRGTLADPAFVGRESELATLSRIARALPEGRVGQRLVLIDAESGGGKSRLLAEAVERAAASGVIVLQGQGVALGGQRPFTLLHGVAEGLVKVLAADAAGTTALAADLADVAPAIVRALPALAPALRAGPESDLGPEQFGEVRSLGGLRRLLTATATPARPVLLVLDDCQWSDALTIRLLADLFGEPDDAKHLAVIAAFRSEEVGAQHPLRAIKGARTLHLGPLPARSIGLLAESMAGPLPDDATETVVRLADGNPFMAAAVLRGLVESEAIVAEPEGWTVDPARLPDVQTARRSAAFLVRRLELLEPDALQLLSVGAVLGKQFDSALAVRIAGDPDDAAEFFEDARRRRLLWFGADATTCTFFHDKIRESLLARLDDEVRRELHGQAADALIACGATDGDAVFDLAYHLHAAQRQAEALPYALAAAELARGRYALESALAHYRMAAEGVDPADRATRRRIAEGLGDVLTLQGAYTEAGAALDAARELVEDPAQAAGLDGKLGELAFKHGDVAVARDRLEGALRLLGRRVPGRVALVLALGWEVLVQAVHSALPKLTTGRRAPEGHETDFLAMRMYSRLAYVYWFHSGKVACAWSHLRGMNLAERYRPSAEVGQAWSEHAPVMTMLPWYGRAIRYAQKSLEVRQRLNDVWGQGQSLGFTGVARYAASQFDEAQAACEEAIRLLRRTGDQWEVNTASWNRALCLLRKGDLRKAVDVATGTLEAALAIGDQTAAGIALSIWARATEGQVPVALVRELFDAGSGDAQTAAELQLAEALVHRADGDLPAAVEALDRACRTVREGGLRQEYIAPVFAWHATVLREQAERTSPYEPQLRAARLRAARHAGRVARGWARAYRNNGPHAWREAALLATLRGRRRRAERCLQRSERAAARIGAAHEAALTWLVRARLEHGEASPEYAVAADAVAGFDPGPSHRLTAGSEPATLSIFDRFAALLRAGRTIAAATTEHALEAAIRDAALRLLRAERCHLIPVGAVLDGRLTTQSGEPLDGISRTLLKLSLEAGEPVAALDEAGSTDSLLLSGIRSALAAPILVNGKARVCLYVTHEQLGELFGEDETQLAAFIATLGGAGYEHLLDSETRFRALAQSSSDVITLVGTDGIVGYQSAAAGTVFGLPATALIGREVSTWAHPEDAPALREVLGTAAANGRLGHRVECRLRHADGSYRFAECVVTNLLTEPTVAALVINTRDITDRTIAADQLHLVEERERIARDLHDVVVQRLFAIGLGLDTLANGLPDAASTQVRTATDELHHTIRDIRGAILTLHSDEPEQPLRERLRIVIDRAELALGFAPTVTLDPSVDAAPEELHWHLLATVREGLSNAAKHSGATEVTVQVDVVGKELVATVSDNGRGLPAERDESGLANLRRRAEIAGGSMSAEPGPDGRGLVLTWRAPLPRGGRHAVTG